MSSSTASGRSRSAASIAARPSCALCVSWPATSSSRASDSAPSSLSSTIRMRRPIAGADATSSGGDVCVRHAGQDWETNREFGAAAKSIAAHVDRSIVHLDQRLHERQADAETVARSLQRRIHLREHLEEIRQMLGGNADPVIAHADNRLLALVLDRQPDVTVLVGELASVVQQVADNLRQPRGIGMQVDLVRRQRDRQLLSLALVQRTDGFDCLLRRPPPTRSAPCGARCARA